MQPKHLRNKCATISMLLHSNIVDDCLGLLYRHAVSRQFPYIHLWVDDDLCFDRTMTATSSSNLCILTYNHLGGIYCEKTLSEAKPCRNDSKPWCQQDHCRACTGFAFYHQIHDNFCIVWYSHLLSFCLYKTTIHSTTLCNRSIALFSIQP